jgi:hypothetical protein
MAFCALTVYFLCTVIGNNTVYRLYGCIFTAASVFVCMYMYVIDHILNSDFPRNSESTAA